MKKQTEDSKMYSTGITVQKWSANWKGHTGYVYTKQIQRRNTQLRLNCFSLCPIK